MMVLAGGSMLYRVGISIAGDDLKRLKLLQKRFGLRSRSELFRELAIRYERLESQWSALNQCLQGYLAEPESAGEESRHILRTAMKNQPAEDWS